MNTQRPIYLNVMQYRFPIMAIVSILHRVSGVIMFILLPFMLYLLHLSLTSTDSFSSLQQLLLNPAIKILLWIMVSASVFHLIAGIRHLLMDMGLFESLNAGRITAILVITLGIIAIILAGVWIW